MIPIVEIFLSIEGEGIRSGRLCTFVRTAGCNLRCSYCDTAYSFDVSKAQQMTVEQVMQRVRELECKTITLTGGEPLLQGEVINRLIPQLLNEGYDINIETNGSIDVGVVQRNVTDKLMFTIDWKSPSSLMSNEMKAINLQKASPKDVIKFVVGSKDDLFDMERVLHNRNILAHIYVSPVFGKIELVDIVDFLKEHKLYNVILQVQLHKIIWNPSERGV